MKNLIAFFEIPTNDFQKSVDFYQKVFDTQLLVGECGEEQMACFVQGDETVGAVCHAPGFRPSEHGVLIHFHCTGLDRMLQQVTAHGGQITIPKTKIHADGKGYFAVFADPAGNRIGLYADQQD